MPIKLVVGLGNPGKKYENTRHNVGYGVIDFFKSDKTPAMRPPTGLRLYKPEGVMNECGRSVANLVQREGYAGHEILVVCDDFALPLGTIRIRPGGSSGGHNGLQSIIDELRTEGFPRLRIGVGFPDKDPTLFVLEPFRHDEILTISLMKATASEAIIVAVRDGLQRAMNEFNGIRADA